MAATVGPAVPVGTGLSPKRRVLAAEARVRAAHEALGEARREWAKVAREVTPAAAARALGIIRQVVG
jgi:hypothetical protein